MSALLDLFKEYARLDDFTDEEATVSMMVSAAENTLLHAGVPVPEDPFLAVDGKDLHASYRLAVLMLATHFYENRTVITPAVIRGESVPLPYGLQTIVLQLKGRGLNEP